MSSVICPHDACTGPERCVLKDYCENPVNNPPTDGELASIWDRHFLQCPNRQKLLPSIQKNLEISRRHLEKDKQTLADKGTLMK